MKLTMNIICSNASDFISPVLTVTVILGQARGTDENEQERELDDI